MSERRDGSVDPNPTTSEWRVVDSYSTGGGVHDSWRAIGPWRATQDEARSDAAAGATLKREMEFTNSYIRETHRQQERAEEAEEIVREHESTIVRLTCDLADTPARAESAEAVNKVWHDKYVAAEADLNAIRDTRFAWDAMMQRLVTSNERAEKAESERDYLQGLVDESNHLKRAEKSEAQYRMEREDHLEASESYVKASKEREDWRLRAVEAERVEDDFARQYNETLARAEKAEARLAELVLEANDMLRCVENADDYQEARLATRRFRKKLRDIEGGEHG